MKFCPKGKYVPTEYFESYFQTAIANVKRNWDVLRNEIIFYVRVRLYRILIFKCAAHVSVAVAFCFDSPGKDVGYERGT